MTGMNFTQLLTFGVPVVGFIFTCYQFYKKLNVPVRCKTINYDAPCISLQVTIHPPQTQATLEKIKSDTPILSVEGPDGKISGFTPNTKSNIQLFTIIKTYYPILPVANGTSPTIIRLLMADDDFDPERHVFIAKFRRYNNTLEIKKENLLD